MSFLPSSGQNDMSYGRGSFSKKKKDLKLFRAHGSTCGPLFWPNFTLLPLIAYSIHLQDNFVILTTLHAILTSYHLINLAFDYINFIIMLLDKIKYCMLMNLPLVSLSIWLLFLNFPQFDKFFAKSYTGIYVIFCLIFLGHFLFKNFFITHYLNVLKSDISHNF